MIRKKKKKKEDKHVLVQTAQMSGFSVFLSFIFLTCLFDFPDHESVKQRI